MISLSKEIQDKYPKQHEIEAIMLKTRIMRARVLRDGAVRIWSMLRRGMSGRAGSSSHVEA
ncbi:MAG TPA: hypothetical protein VMY41_16975 [Thermohalobaculum sp.]|nr:hypothetical protein [Thermohalobaculum sp.]